MSVPEGTDPVTTNPEATKPVDEPPVDTSELLETDGMPMDSPWHRDNMNLLINALKHHLRPRTDYYVGGNMFIYFNRQQARNRDYRGPDFFYVANSSLEPYRRFWVTWDEGAKFPDVIIELSSPSTVEEDHTTKLRIYEEVFRTRNYFCYDPDTQVLEGWRLNGDLMYTVLRPDERGWLWSHVLQLWLGTWHGEYAGTTATWLRWYTGEGELVLLPEEDAQRRAAEQERRAAAEQRRAAEQERRAAAEQRRADDEARRATAAEQRAEAAEAELARLRALLGQPPPPA